MSHNTLIIAPLMVPLVLAVCSLLGRRSATVQNVAAVLCHGLLFGLAGMLIYKTQSEILIQNLGGWSAPFGITLNIDGFSAIMLGLTALIGLATSIYSMGETDARGQNPFREPLKLFLIAGINMAFVTGDLFNLYVAFEVMLLASYGLLTLEAQGKEAPLAWPYIAINLFGSALFLMAAAWIYSIVGSLNMAHIGLTLSRAAPTPSIIWAGLLLTLVFGIKSGLFPLYYWLPKSYPLLTASTAAFFGGLLTKVGLYTLVRLFATILPHELYDLHHVIIVLSLPTMLFGVLGAVSQTSIKRILSYHILSQVGFMLLAIGLFGTGGLLACVVYIVHHIVVKSSLFLVGGLAEDLQGSDKLSNMGGLWKAYPILGLCFVAQAWSLAGLPPLSGFWGKYLIVVEALGRGANIAVVVSLVASLLTLISMLKIWLGTFWKALPESATVKPFEPRHRLQLGVLIGLCLVSLSIGLGQSFFLDLSQNAVDQLMDPQLYRHQVLSNP